jgi:phosphoserine phosphatase
MHHFGIFKTLSVAMLVALLATACATAPVAPLSKQTGDLAEVAADTLEIAQMVGHRQVLVVLDIDNTILAMEQGLGSDQWYEWQKETSKLTPCDHRTVADRLAVQGAMYFASAMRPTQADAPQLVRKIQQAGVRVIALTSRGVGFRLQTFRELRRNGYDFRRSAIGPDGGWPEDFLPDNGIRPARYEDGVFLTTGQHKGAMLQALLSRTGTPLPRVIIMADDKQDNLDAVIETFGGLDASVRAWRYSGEDENVAGFDEDASHVAWQELLPAMETIQRVLGPDNFTLPQNNRPPGCMSMDGDTAR